MEYFKLVAVNSEGNLESVCRNSFFPRLAKVIYKKDEVAVPNIKNTKLFAFDNLEDAKNFCNRLRHCSDEKLEVWSCKITNPTEATGLLKEVDNWGLTESLEDWLLANEDLRKKIHILDIDVPQGTVAVDSIKLLEKVYDSNEDE